jgi:hypothetical protein
MPNPKTKRNATNMSTGCGGAGTQGPDGEYHSGRKQEALPSQPVGRGAAAQRAEHRPEHRGADHRPFCQGVNGRSRGMNNSAAPMMPLS